MIAIFLLLSAAPGVASSGVSIPEPSNWALFAMGVAGVLIGRFGLKGRGPQDGTKDDGSNPGD